MRIITDPESWMGLRAADAETDELAPRAERKTPPRRHGEAGIGRLLRRMLRLFR
jgi:hypothetical protein